MKRFAIYAAYTYDEYLGEVWANDEAHAIRVAEKKWPMFRNIYARKG